MYMCIQKVSSTGKCQKNMEKFAVAQCKRQKKVQSVGEKNKPLRVSVESETQKCTQTYTQRINTQCKICENEQDKMDWTELALSATLLSHGVKFFNCNPLFGSKIG